jgi:hypothetical protein
MPGAKVSFVDTLDMKPNQSEETSPRENATPAQQSSESLNKIPSEVADLVEPFSRRERVALPA